jgi:hypothetical protein
VAVEEQTFPSTTWEWRKIKIARPPEATRAVSTKSRRFFGLPPRNPREILTIRIKFRGGAEAWYEVHARGSIARYPGHLALHDVMRDINRTE